MIGNLIYSLIIMGLVLIFSNSCKKNDNNPLSGVTVTDIDGNVYHTVTIGTQVWMVENLRWSDMGRPFNTRLLLV